MRPGAGGAQREMRGPPLGRMVLWQAQATPQLSSSTSEGAFDRPPCADLQRPMKRGDYTVGRSSKDTKSMAGDAVVP